MKKATILFLFVVCVSLSVSAQGLYFDIGAGFGYPMSKIDGTDATKVYESKTGVPFNDGFAFDLSLKAGYGPFGTIPLYVVGEFGCLLPMYTAKTSAGQSTGSAVTGVFLIGPGVLFYPIPLIQLGFSFGLSMAMDDTARGGGESLTLVQYDPGFGLNFSVAVDLGQNKHGLLLGLKYSYFSNKVTGESAKRDLSAIGIFVKYAFRQKPPALFGNK